VRIGRIEADSPEDAMSLTETRSSTETREWEENPGVLRAALWLDAAASGVMGLALLLTPPAMIAFAGLPSWLATGAGLTLIPFAAAVAWLAARRQPPRAGVWALVGVNALWVAESVATIAAGVVEGSPLGIIALGLILLQAAAVAALAVMQVVGLYQVPDPARRP
jgi:hypothetical protein